MKESIIFARTEFTAITYRMEGEDMPGLLVHDLADTNHDGDMIIGNGCQMPATQEEADAILTNETGETCFHRDGDVYVID